MSRISTSDAFSRVAIWQVLAFVLLTCFVWATELLNLTSVVFGVAPKPPDLYHAFFLSIGIISTGIIAIGHTYEKQRDAIKQIMNACLYCHRVKTSDKNWEHVEEYFMKHFPIAMQRGICPECEKMLSDIDKHNKPTTEGTRRAAASD